MKLGNYTLIFENGGLAVEKDGSTFLSWTQSSATEGASGNYGFGGFGGFGGGHGGRR